VTAKASLSADRWMRGEGSQNRLEIVRRESYGQVPALKTLRTTLRLGRARVSTSDHDFFLQLDVLQAANCPCRTAEGRVGPESTAL